MNASKQCARALPSTRAISATSRQAVSRRSFYAATRTAPTSLHLDFLAPAWQSRDTQSTRSQVPWQTRHSLPARPQTRAFSVTTHIRAPAKAITNPRTDDSGAEMTITITPRASHRLRAIAANDNNPNLALRISVESGGCHGFQYLMSLVNVADADAVEDTVFEEGEGKGEGEGEGYRPKVVMDEPSLELLKGSSVDYTMELIGSQFKVTGIPGATSSCGCGTSFDVA